VAKETRRQRRDARRASAEAAEARPRGRQAPVTAPATVEVAHPEPRRRGGGFFSFVGESVAELRKVDWPNRAQVIQGTIVVLIACAVVGAFLWGADQALRPLVREVLLGQ
jgi:preprotein translocase subunit SecE